MTRKIDFIWSETLKDDRKWERWRNTHLSPTWLWPLVIGEDDYAEALGQAPRGAAKLRRLVQRVLRRALPFWPRVTDAAYWSSGDDDKAGTPDNYADQTEDVRLLAAEVAARVSRPDAAVLDLGCNCGRCLASAADLGLTNLHGVDINPAAIERMTEIFPVLDGKVTAQRDFFQRFLENADAGAYEIVFTRGATVELVHPSFALVRELCRVAREYVVLMIRENGFAYPRDWIGEFEASGFMLTKLVRPVHQDLDDTSGKTGEGTSLLVFRRRPKAYLKAAE